MAVESASWLLTDLAERVWNESLTLTTSELGIPGSTVTARRLRGGLAGGVDVVEIGIGAVRVEVVPTRGMGIRQATVGGIRIGWDSPVRGPVHPAFVRPAERGGLGWLAGFDELVVRCGLDSNGSPCRDTVLDNNGNPVEVDLYLHGRIANIPAHRVELRADPVSGVLVLTGAVTESAMFGPALELVTEIEVRGDGPFLTIRDRVTNPTARPAELELLYHVNFGRPLLGAGARAHVPFELVTARDPRAAEDLARWAEYGAPTPGYVEQVYYFEPAQDETGRSLAVLEAVDGARAVAVRFSPAELPCFSLWKNTADAGSGYVTGFEPATNYPNPKPDERAAGRVVALAPGATHAATLSLELAAGVAETRRLADEVASIQAGAAGVIGAGHGDP